MSKDKNLIAILLAILAAALYALSTPVSKVMLQNVLLLGEPVTMIFIIASIFMAVGCWIAAK